MRQCKVTFYKVEYDSKDNKKQSNLGHVVVSRKDTADGCSVIARAFRVASLEQQSANAVSVTEL